MQAAQLEMPTPMVLVPIIHGTGHKNREVTEQLLDT